ncbi:hypothetical protein K505DRAFT_321759 [Melanomma pulvis-pyrius CBS 109.77]|uniref:Rhodopsin domain-containing protein n=1 Tax=Melanomma pulvis-pyrius CBS 109.77 TaxID=1314802 RepID=A0A6A6XPS5_9PLEO|nr:hypothetical protein K505DRAFT_321759 [Melanomma pulvis-pyrius CBS 109.77]
MPSFKDLLLDLSASQPPDGTESNFDNPPNNRPLALGIIVPCAILTILMTFMRIYVKTFIVRKWHWDDYLLPLAFLFSAAEFAASVHVYTYAPVIHQWDMTIRTVSKFLLDFHVGAVFYFMTIMTLKIAILIQFLRIFVPAGERSKTYWATHIMIWINTIFYITTVFIEIFACKPMRKQWDPLVIGGKCVNSPLSYMVSQSFNLVLDVLILLWTQKVIWHLHMPLGRKIKLGALFFAGLIACIFGALSVWTTVKMMHTPNDQAYWAAWNALFTFPETTSGFLVLCLPVVPKFFKSFLPSSTKNSSIPTSDVKSPNPKSPPRSWWHITGASGFSSKMSSTASSGRWTGTTATQNGDHDGRALCTIDEGKQNLEFSSFGSPDVHLRLDCENHDHRHLGPHTHLYEQEPVSAISAIMDSRTPTDVDIGGYHAHGHGAGLGRGLVHYTGDGQDHDRIYRDNEVVYPPRQTDVQLEGSGGEIHRI